MQISLFGHGKDLWFLGKPKTTLVTMGGAGVGNASVTLKWISGSGGSHRAIPEVLSRLPFD